MAHGVLFLNSPSCQSKVGLQTYSSIRTIIWLVLQIKATQHVWNGDNMEVSSWPRTQAPTAAPSAPAPVPPAAQLRHWPGPPSSTHSPPRSCSTCRSAPPTVSFRADHPPGQLETSNSAMCQSLQQKRLRLEFNVTHRDNGAERGRGAKWFTLNVVDARSHKDHIRFEISRTESHHCLNVGVKKTKNDNTAIGVKYYSWSLMQKCNLQHVEWKPLHCFKWRPFHSDTHLWLHVHETDLVLIQRPVDGFQAGAIQIIFILTEFNKSAEVQNQPWFSYKPLAVISFHGRIDGVQHSLAPLYAGVESCFVDEVVFYAFPLVAPPGSGSIFRSHV